MKKLTFIICAAFIAIAQTCLAASYNYVSAEELKGWLEEKRPVLLVDIQENKDFAKHHIKGSLETNAYPVKSELERKALDAAVNKEKAFEGVVVICPRGKGGAKRTYDYLNKQGVKEAKLTILTGGMEKWPYEKWVGTK